MFISHHQRPILTQENYGMVKLKDNRMDDIWLVDFYAPWCGYCKKLEPVWQEVGAELTRSGSPVRVGKMDATAYSGVASEFGVRGYPTIKLLKGELAYNYKGPRTKDDIIEFANRVAGPAVRSLPSRQMFEHILKRHNVLFVYVGGESPLKEKYIEVASELIVYTYFFYASEDILTESVTLPELPSVLVFKDGTYFTYDEYEDGSLSSWVNRERFQSYMQIDGFTLYELGETEHRENFACPRGHMTDSSAVPSILDLTGMAQQSYVSKNICTMHHYWFVIDRLICPDNIVVFNKQPYTPVLRCLVYTTLLHLDRLILYKINKLWIIQLILRTDK
ncbi:hypothetical protein IRJ41_003491 [Triplophysa rosa]|uniref:protein disulfide-isomerase n=1 Tax=Triplophysa rosa TaxID=992332 RepID=A0A9W7W883_TRIRA|nr:hypothetical protein IRJ41_003491 [Triplophysa rosa]